MSFTFSKNDTSELEIFIRLVNLDNAEYIKKDLVPKNVNTYTEPVIEDGTNNAKCNFNFTSETDEPITFEYTVLSLDDVIAFFPSRLDAFKEVVKTYITSDNKFDTTKDIGDLKNAYLTLFSGYTHIISAYIYDSSLKSVMKVLHDDEARTLTFKYKSLIFKPYVYNYPIDRTLNTTLDGLYVEQYVPVEE